MYMKHKGILLLNLSLIPKQSEVQNTIIVKHFGQGMISLKYIIFQLVYRQTKRTASDALLAVMALTQFFLKHCYLYF